MASETATLFPKEALPVATKPRDARDDILPPWLNHDPRSGREAAPAPEPRAETSGRRFGEEARAAAAPLRRRKDYRDILRAEAEADRGAAFLLKKLGPDADAFLSRFGANTEVMSRAADLAAARRLRASAETDVPVGLIGRAGRTSRGRSMNIEDLPVVAGVADRLKAGLAVEPIRVVKGRGGSYRVVQGETVFRTLADRLRLPVIPVSIVPSVEAISDTALAEAMRAPSEPRARRKRLSWRERELLRLASKLGVTKRRAANACAAER